jgi:uncharacterized surface protein with fasciclin (FAS1) repeats
MRKVISFLLVFALVLMAVVPALAQDRPTLIEALQNDPDGRFTTLVTALETAGLAEALSEEGDLTVLAPTNDAFAEVLDFLGVSEEELLADTETLTEILNYHVIEERTRSSQLFIGATLPTVQGEEVTFETNAAGQLTANGVVVGSANIVTSGGVIHVLNGVLLPSTVQETAAANRAHVRVAHFSPDRGAVDIYINGELSNLQNMTFGRFSEWLELVGDSYEIAVAPAGGEPGNATTFDVEGGTWTTIAAVGVVGLNSFELRAISEDYSPISESTARLTVMHALAGAPAVDLRLNGNIVVGRLAYPGSLGNNDGVEVVDVTAGRYNLSVVPAGASTPALLSVDGFPLNNGSNYFLAIVGTPANPQYVLRSTNVTTGG